MNLRQKYKKAKKEIERLKAQTVYILGDQTCLTQKYCVEQEIDPYRLWLDGEQYVNQVKESLMYHILTSDFVKDYVCIEEHIDIYGQKTIRATIEMPVNKEGRSA